ncbi:MAG: hypothetical protein PF436_03895 [Prolixibacteraceae bacterium]|jgi:hypothetical protein|nr:hypothetical protein [Prolixibacteraceae bacterium]
MGTEFSVIEQKLLKFTRKYYLDQILKGVIFFLILLLILSLSAITIEYIIYLPINHKKVLLLVYLILLLISFVYYLGKPIVGIAGIFTTISEKKMNSIIVSHFPEIKDHLWNAIELNKSGLENENYSHELVVASLNQKIASLKGFNFTEAISIKKNLKFSFVILFFLLLITILTIFTPNYIKSSSQRLINYNQSYTKPSPFDFEILNESLLIGKGENIRVRVKVITNTPYESVNIEYGNNAFVMKNDSTEFFSYLFTNVNNSLPFRVSINNYKSDEYILKVNPKPILISFDIQIQKPRYTGMDNETHTNLTEIVVPDGSNCTFDFNSIDTDSIIIERANTIDVINNDNSYQLTANQSTKLNISLKNEFYLLDNILTIKIETIKDEYPTISVNQMLDSIDFSSVYFKGLIDDDYGFSRLEFVTEINNEIDSVYELSIQPNSNQQTFFYGYNFIPYTSVSKTVNYYFRILDNDHINGPKSSVSEYFTFVFPDTKDLMNKQDSEYEDIENVVNESLNLTNQLKNDINELQRKMFESDMSDWERKEVVKNIISKKDKLENAINEIRERNDELSNYMSSFSDQDQEIIKKQEQIQKLLDEVMNEELKKLLDEFNKMMEDFDKNRMNEIKDEMDISLDDLTEQLDRNLEMLKKMQMEQKLDMIMGDLQKHIQKQKELSKKIEDGENPSDLVDDQQKEKESLGNLEKEYKKVNDINDELKDPVNLMDFQKEFDQIQDEFEKSLENQKNNNKKKSQESMQQNSQNMQNLAEMMQQMMDAAFMKQASESLENLIQILDNTVTFSFSQEDIISIPLNNNFDHQIMNQQKKLFSDFKVIRDSLYALALRQPQINSAVNKEIVAIETSFKQIDRDFNEDRISSAKTKQQIVLTSANNLALFLSEVIKNIQQQLANSKPGNQNCQKPGNNPNPSSMGNSLKEMQKSMQQQLEKMMQMMKQGEGSQKMEGEMGKALSQQEKMRSTLQKMMNQGNVGSDAHETLKQADELLNKVREDILRNNISQNTLNRQQEIMTRLLEAENSQNERDLEEKRRSETSKEQRISESAKYFDNSSSNIKFNEQLLRKKLILKGYYQNKYQEYVNQLDSINGAAH